MVNRGYIVVNAFPTANISEAIRQHCFCSMSYNNISKFSPEITGHACSMSVRLHVRGPAHCQTHVQVRISNFIPVCVKIRGLIEYFVQAR